MLYEDKKIAELVGVITVGYPDENPKARSRKKLKDIVHYENW